MNFFQRYLKNYTDSDVLNAKVVLLTSGLDFDFRSIRKFYPNLKERYKANKIRVSDRHFIFPGSDQRNFIPDELILNGHNSNPSLAKVYFKEDSPLLLAAQKNKFIILDKKSKRSWPVIIKPAPLYSYTQKKHKGIALDEFVSVVGMDKVSILPYDGCENWVCGQQCKFCGANPNRMGFTGIKPNIFEIKSKFGGDYKKWWAHYRDYMQENVRRSFKALLKDQIGPHFHFAIISGNLSDLDFEWEMGFDLIEAVKDLVDFREIDSYFNLMPPKDFKKIHRAHNYGFRNMCFNLECFDNHMYLHIFLQLQVNSLIISSLFVLFP